MRPRRETVEQPLGTLKMRGDVLSDENTAEGDDRDGAALAGLQPHAPDKIVGIKPPLAAIRA
jgi:hypothetical protein